MMTDTRKRRQTEECLLRDRAPTAAVLGAQDFIHDVTETLKSMLRLALTKYSGNEPAVLVEVPLKKMMP